MLLFYVFFVQKEQTFVQIFRKEDDVFPDFSRCFWGNTTSCDVEFQSDLWGIERSGFFNDREKWVKGFENQRV